MYDPAELEYFMSNGGSVFGGDVRNAQENIDRSEALYKQIKAELDATVAAKTDQEPGRTSKMMYWPGTQIDKESGHIDTSKAGTK